MISTFLCTDSCRGNKPLISSISFFDDYLVFNFERVCYTIKYSRERNSIEIVAVTNREE